MELVIKFGVFLAICQCSFGYGSNYGSSGQYQNQGSSGQYQNQGQSGQYQNQGQSGQYQNQLSFGQIGQQGSLGQSQSSSLSSYSRNSYYHQSGSSGSHTVTHVHCTNYREYNEIQNLWRDNPCMDAIRAFQLIADLYQHHHTGGTGCALLAIQKMAAAKESGHHATCSCHGDIYKDRNYPHIQSFPSSYDHCKMNHDFLYLFGKFYNNNGGRSSCMSHQSIWKRLYDMPVYSYDCQLAFVMHVDHTYSQQQNHCSCKATSGSIAHTSTSPTPALSTSTEATSIYGPVTHTHCTNYREYNDVINLWLDNPCMDAIRAFKLLASLYHHHYSIIGHGCVTLAIQKMAEAEASGHHAQCSCPGQHHIYKHEYQYVQGFASSKRHCSNDTDFMSLYNMFYQEKNPQYGYPQQHINCIPHAQIWRSLHNMPLTGFDCQLAFVMHVDSTYSQWTNYCQCKLASGSVTPAPTTSPTITTVTHRSASTTSTSMPTSTSTTTTASLTSRTMTPTTTSSTPTTKTTTPTTTTTTRARVSATTMVKSTKPLPVFHICPKLSTITDIAQHNLASNTNASTCPSGNHQSPEAFVMNHCTVQHPATWDQGLKVMDQCSAVPIYTPVATFFNGQYVPNGGNTGVFLGCIQNGFKLGVQDCVKGPTVVHIETGGIFTKDPNVYFTIL